MSGWVNCEGIMGTAGGSGGGGGWGGKVVEDDELTATMIKIMKSNNYYLIKVNSNNFSLTKHS